MDTRADSSDNLDVHTYVTVSFYLGLIASVIRTLVMACVEYPRKRSVNLGEDVAGSLLSIGFLVWAGILLFQ